MEGGIIVPKCGEEGCGKNYMPIPCSHKLEASEWYCSYCHKSIRMPAETARKLIIIEQRNK